MTLHACKVLENRLENVLATTYGSDISTAEIVGTMEIVKTNFCSSMKTNQNINDEGEDDNG